MRDPKKNSLNVPASEITFDGFSLDLFELDLLNAQSGAELRRGWAVEGKNVMNSPLPDSEIKSTADAVLDKLEKMGTDLDAEDERIDGLHIARESPRTFFAQYFRFLSGLDPDCLDESELALAPQQSLRHEALDDVLDRIALPYTADPRYDRPSADRRGRKAGRVIDNPFSPFWGATILTDVSMGRDASSEVNKLSQLILPTGILLNEQLAKLQQTPDTKIGHGRKIPPQVLAQQVIVGDVDTSPIDTFDTEDGMVQELLEYIDTRAA